MNNKAQYAPRQSYMSMSPVFVIGIVLFIFPYVSPIIGWRITGWLDSVFFYLGLAFILVGALLSIFGASE